MTVRRALTVFALMVFAVLVAAGCRKPPPALPPGGPPGVPVSHPIQREVVEYVEYTGRADAVESAGIRARVTGFLVRAAFTEGAEVHKGDLLFEIDPRPYEAQLAQSESQVRLYEARRVEAEKNRDRIKKAVAEGGGSQAELDAAEASVKAAAAQVDAAKSSVELYKLNVGFTKVFSPIDGQVSRFYYTPGNLVNQDSTLLTTVVSTDPIYAYFDMDERTVVRVRTAINQGKIRPRRAAASAGLTAAVGAAASAVAAVELPVSMGLDPDDNYPFKGAVNFVNNVVNPSTGTIAVRGVFPNPRPPGGRRVFSPGMFVRIRLPIGQPAPGLLVADRAIGSDQGLKYVYVVDAEKKVQYRRVKTGALQDDGLRVIDEGLKADDLVVVGALQQLRPKMDVEPEAGAMPIPGAPTPPAGAPARSAGAKDAASGAASGAPKDAEKRGPAGGG